MAVEISPQFATSADIGSVSKAISCHGEIKNLGGSWGFNVASQYLSALLPHL